MEVCCSQGCTNVLWGLAKQDAKRLQLITGKGQLFKDMADQLVQQADRLMSQNGLPVNFSMLLWALGTINFHPGVHTHLRPKNVHTFSHNDCLGLTMRHTWPRAECPLCCWRLVSLLWCANTYQKDTGNEVAAFLQGAHSSGTWC